jgi:hypothetical protein
MPRLLGGAACAAPLLYLARGYAARSLRSAHKSVLSFVLRLLAIVVCGGAGGFIGWLIVSLFGGTGIGAAIAAAIMGMVLAASFWAGGVALIRALKSDP